MVNPPTPPPITTSSCIISSSGIPSRVIPQGSLGVDTLLFGCYSIALRLDTKDGSALRGTRASIMRSDVDSGVPGGYPRVEHEMWPGLPSPCRKFSRRGDGVTSFVSLCSLPRDPKPQNGLDI